MRPWSIHPGVRLVLASLLLSACDGPTDPAPDDPADRPAPNTAPAVNAGADLVVPLPLNTAWLRGTAFDAESNIESHWWNLLAAPDAADPRFLDRYALETGVEDLVAGVYVFELVARDRAGLTARDIVAVHVVEPSTPLPEEEFVFENLAWDCEWACGLRIEGIPEELEAPAVTGVFVQHGDDPAWVEVRRFSRHSPPRYYWFISNGALQVYDLSEWAWPPSLAARVKLRWVPPGS